MKHARYYWLLLAEGHLNRRLFDEMLRRIWALPVRSMRISFTARSCTLGSALLILIHVSGPPPFEIPVG